MNWLQQKIPVVTETKFKLLQMQRRAAPEKLKLMDALMCGFSIK